MRDLLLWHDSGTGTPKDRDEVKRREVWECDGWVWDLETPSLETYVRGSPNHLHTRVSYTYSLTTLTRNSAPAPPLTRSSVLPLTRTPPSKKTPSLPGPCPQWQSLSSLSLSFSLSLSLSLSELREGVLLKSDQTEMYKGTGIFYKGAQVGPRGPHKTDPQVGQVTLDHDTLLTGLKCSDLYFKRREHCYGDQ
jgi:hypothetical protein